MGLKAIQMKFKIASPESLPSQRIFLAKNELFWPFKYNAKMIAIWGVRHRRHLTITL